MTRRRNQVVLWLVWVALGSLRTSAGLQDPEYLPTLLEDPLQPVWDRLDTIPNEILRGFKDQVKSFAKEMQDSLQAVLLRLTALEDKMDSAFTTMRIEFGDFVSDRLVNAETMILEDVTKLSNTVSSSAKNIHALKMEVVSLRGKLEVMENRTETDAANDQSAKVEVMEAKVEEVQGSVEGVGANVETVQESVAVLTAKVEDVQDKLEAVVNRTQPSVVSRAYREVAERLVEAPRGDTSHLPRDCSDIHWHHPEAPSGVFETFPTLDPKAPVSAYCDMGQEGDKETGGWTVLLRRRNSTWGLENFNRSWAEYREGFGRVGEGEWWYGLAPLHALTYRQPYEVDIFLHDMELGTFHASYTTFRVESEGRHFRLVVEGFSGNVTFDALGSKHHGQSFSTYDRDLDDFSGGSCASNNGGGWWYAVCHKASLTATFPTSPDHAARTIRWYRASGWLILDDVTMKIRPTNYGQRFQSYMDGE